MVDPVWELAHSSLDGRLRDIDLKEFRSAEGWVSAMAWCSTPYHSAKQRLEATLSSPSFKLDGGQYELRYSRSLLHRRER